MDDRKMKQDDPEYINPAFKVPRHIRESRANRVTAEKHEQRHRLAAEVHQQGGARKYWTPLRTLLFFATAVVLVSFFLSAQGYTALKSHLAASSSSTPLNSLIPLSNQTVSSSKMSSSEQTFIAIKPDGVQRGLVGPIISRFENRGFKLAAIKLVTPGKEHLEKHYSDLSDKPFFPGLVNYMNSGPICAMVWEGRDAVKTGRSILGATNPLASAPGTIRGDYALDVGRNVCHGSDSVENAKKEIALWFKDGEVLSWKSAQNNWVYEKP